MNDSYERRKKRYIDELSNYMFSMDAAIGSIDVSSKEINKLKKLLLSLSVAKNYKKKRKIADKIKIVLKNIVEKENCFISMKKLDDYITKYRPYLDSGEQMEIRRLVGHSLGTNFLNVLDRYLSTYSCYESLLEEQKENKNNSQNQREKKEESNTNNTKNRSNPSNGYTKNIYGYSESNNKPIRNSNNNSSLNNSIRLSDDSSHIIRQDSREDSNVINNIDDLKKVMKNLKEGSSDYYVLGISFINKLGIGRYEANKMLKNGLKINELYNHIMKNRMLFRKQSASAEILEDLIQLGIKINEVMPKILLSNNTELDQFVTEMNLYNAFALYKNAYSKFYSISAKIRKESIENLDILTKSQYTKAFNRDIFEIIHPDELKRNVNTKVTNNLKTNNLMMISDVGFATHDFIAHATKFMGIDELVVTYKQILEKQFSNSYGPRASKLFEEKRKLIQFIFADLILERKKTENKNIELEDEERKKELINICKQYLGEEPLFYKEKEVMLNSDLEEARKRAASRLYGMDKMELSYAKSSGQYARFMHLVNVKGNDLTSQQVEDTIDELNRMFR